MAGCSSPVMLDARHKAASLLQVHSGGEMGGTSGRGGVSTGGLGNQENRRIVFGLWKLAFPG